MLVLLSLVIVGALSGECTKVEKLFPGLKCLKEYPYDSGHGGFVYVLSGDSGTFAIKQQLKTLHSIQEVNILNKLTSKGIDCVNKFFGFKESDNYIFLQLEYLEGGSLADKIDSKLSPEETLSIFYNLATCVDILHSVSVIHADLKPTNIMFNKDGKLKLIDFGLSVEKGGIAPPQGTPYYIDPDLPLPISQYRIPLELVVYTEAQDLWSLGAILGEMVLGKKLFPLDPRQAYGNRNYVLPKGTWTIFAELLSSTLRTDPKKRSNLFSLIQFTEKELKVKEHLTLNQDTSLSAEDPIDPNRQRSIRPGMIAYKPSFFEMFGELIFISCLVFLIIPFVVWFISRKQRQELRAQNIRNEPFDQPLPDRQAPLAA